MHNNNNKLIEIMGLLRKDTGINNAIDAMEQLSLLLMIKYFYELTHLHVPREEIEGSFLDLFHSEKLDSDIHGLELRTKEVFNNIYSSQKIFGVDNLASDTWNKTMDVLISVPFRIRSRRILERTLYTLDEIDIFSDSEIDFDELLFNMVKDSASSGAFYSPKSLIKAIINVIQPKPHENIYDPAMGTGRTFVEANNYLKGKNNTGLLRSIGKDLSPFAYLVGILNLLLNRIDVSEISISDSLLHGEDLEVDIIVSAFPFGKSLEKSKYENFYGGFSGSLEAMFLKHTMDNLAPGGRAAVIVPDSVLFNNANRLDDLRQELLTRFNLHTVLSLPTGIMAPYSSVKMSVLFFEKTTPLSDIWFYELNTEKPLSKLRPISDSDLEEFLTLYKVRKNTDNSRLFNKECFLNEESFKILLSLSKKSDVEFNKAQMVDLLYRDQEELDKNITSLIEDISTNIEAEYVDKVRIEKIGKLKTGSKLKTDEVSNIGKFPVYGGNGVIGYHQESNRSGNSIIIGKVGAYCGNIQFSSKPYWLTTNAMSLEIIDDEKVYAPYLSYVLKCLDLNNLSTGTAQKFISFDRLYKIEISLPSYKKQIELSKWFESIEERKEKVQRLLMGFNSSIDLTLKNAISEKVLN